MNSWKKVRARIEPGIKGCAPQRLAARFLGQRVVANSIPKGGTHLLTRCLMHFPSLTYSGYHYTEGIPDTHALKKLLGKCSPGRFAAAHLWWSEEAAKLFAAADVRQIVMIRDPRDIVVSGVHFILQRKEHHLHRHFTSLKDMPERLMHYITGVDARYSSQGHGLADIRTSFHNYLRWEDEENSMLLQFEDLIGPRGGGSMGRQKEAIGKIGEHCRINLKKGQIEKIAENVFSTQSVTFRRGASGGWKKYFDNDVKTAFQDVAGDLLLRTGYV